MKRTGTILVFCLLISGLYWGISQQTQTQQEEETKSPYDWFYMQRAYPDNVIDHHVYTAAIEKLKTPTIKSRSTGKWELVGPTNIGGRITALALHPHSQQIIYAGAASGGVFKSVDQGNSWRPVFEEAGRLSIGALAIAPSNPTTLYVGTGEANGSVTSGTFFGDGVYKSTNSGRSWTHIGLDNSFHIGRIAINPQDDTHLVVAATGMMYEKNEDRGVYQTKDGGRSWEQLLFISDSTSCIDVAMNPWNPNIIYAAMWERIRYPSKRQYGGTTSGIYRTMDGGETWTQLTNGLPASTEETGRIGLAIAASNPNILYASFTKNALSNEFDGVYKTTNGGESWEKVNTFSLSRAYNGYGWYFGNMRVDPNDPNSAYLLGINLIETKDGGQRWRTITNRMHVDQHALAIHPMNSDFMVAGNDGGVYTSNDGGQSWQHAKALPITQFYECEISQSERGKYYGGTQDNGTIKVSNGTKDNWSMILGGDGFHTIVDPNLSDIIYAELQWGTLFRSLDGGISFQRQMNGIDQEDRNNWNTPIVLDPSNSQVLYYGTNRLYRSSSRGTGWNLISDDLTKNAYDTPYYGTISTIAVAANNSQVIYVGTDDGNIQVTQNLGDDWTVISDNLPNRYVTSIAVDPQDAATAYATFSGYRNNDYQAHVLRTSDYGQTWQDISNNLPQVPVNELLIDFKKAGTLYVATDLGVWYTENGGAFWEVLGEGLPTTVVTDLVLHKQDRILVASTFGRSMHQYDLTQTSRPDLGLPTVDPDVVTFSIAPNPVLTTGTIQFEAARAAKAVIKLYDLNGRLLLNQNLEIISGFNQLNIDFDNYESGIYLIALEADGKQIAQQRWLKK